MIDVDRLNIVCTIAISFAPTTPSTNEKPIKALSR